MKALILGGTGTLGTEIARQLLERGWEHVVIFSRDELKQKLMASAFENSPRLSFILGDIRDPDSLARAFRGVHTVFHCAALKHVDTLELNPEESVKTNVLGTINVANAAVNAGVPYVVFSSTDKAVEPINAYGMCKGISEKILLRRNTDGVTRFSVFRWGNVVASRGSVIPSFVDAAKSGKPLPLTGQEMTRFWISIQDAVGFMLLNHRKAPGDAPCIPPIKAASVVEVGEAVARLLGKPSPQWVDIPIRPGEKIHETLAPGLSSDTADRYTPEELETLVEACL